MGYKLIIEAFTDDGGSLLRDAVVNPVADTYANACWVCRQPVEDLSCRSRRARSSLSKSPGAQRGKVDAMGYFT